jgi:hypothetical protein
MTTQQVLTETFNSRETYLAWRAEWKRVYAEISADIRVLKLVSKDNCPEPDHQLGREGQGLETLAPVDGCRSQAPEVLRGCRSAEPRGTRQ